MPGSVQAIKRQSRQGREEVDHDDSLPLQYVEEEPVSEGSNLQANLVETHSASFEADDTPTKMRDETDEAQDSDALTRPHRSIYRGVCWNKGSLL